ncbi:RNA polymerase sigma factor [Svornostia abyssi]
MRDDRARIIASIVRTTRDLDLAEDALADALAAAATGWPRTGIPEEPAAWVLTVARRRAIDRLRRRTRDDRSDAALAELERTPSAPPADGTLPDERLELLFACCHPALALDARIALTLRAVARLTTPEIAAAFLTSETAMAQRLVRATRRLADSGIPIEVPSPEQLPERLDGVLGVIYLVFNEGYAASGDAPRVRVDLCDDAIRLGRLLSVLLPDEPEVLGLTALMLFHDARRATRVDADGLAVLLEDQDRARWDRARIAEADGLLERALLVGRRGPYLVQACIAALHASAPSAEDTDWAQIVALYGALLELRPSPVGELARAGAVGMRDGPDAGLQAVDAVRARHPDHDPGRVAAVRADLLRRGGRTDEAMAAYETAIARLPAEAERAFLRARLGELADQ